MYGGSTTELAALMAVFKQAPITGKYDNEIVLSIQ
jgi:hypothetical protein